MFHDLMKEATARLKYERERGDKLTRAYWQGYKEALEKAGRRITTVSRKEHEIWHYNYVYVDREGEIRLDYIDGKRDVLLSDYISKHAGCDGLDRENVHDKCTKCGRCPMYALYIAAVQAAEMRERVFYYEDCEGAERVYITPCAMGAELYGIFPWTDKVLKSTAVGFEISGEEIIVLDDMENRWHEEEFEDTVFLSKEEAQRALKGGRRVFKREYGFKEQVEKELREESAERRPCNVVIMTREEAEARKKGGEG